MPHEDDEERDRDKERDRRGSHGSRERDREKEREGEGAEKPKSPANNRGEKPRRRSRSASAAAGASPASGHESPHRESAIVGNSPPPQKGLKRFFLNIREKMGNMEQTQYSSSFLKSCQEIDAYKTCLEELAVSLVHIVQQNPKHVQKPMEYMDFDYPDDQSPFELLVPALKTFGSLLRGVEEPTKQVEQSSKICGLHRDLQRRARRALKDMRYFLCTEYPDLTEARRLLNQRRQDMDMSKHELKNAKSAEVVEMKNTVYELSQKQFDMQLQKVLGMIDKFPSQREHHLKNVHVFYTVLRYYHEQVAATLK